MHSTNRAVAFAAILLSPIVTHAATDRHSQDATQPAASYTFQGTVRAYSPKTGLDLITGVGMALRLVHVTAAPAAHGGGGAAASLAGLDLKAGDVVRVECHRAEEGLVADRIERVEVPKP